MLLDSNSQSWQHLAGNCINNRNGYGVPELFVNLCAAHRRIEDVFRKAENASCLPRSKFTRAATKLVTSQIKPFLYCSYVKHLGSSALILYVT